MKGPVLLLLVLWSVVCVNARAAEDSFIPTAVAPGTDRNSVTNSVSQSFSASGPPGSVSHSVTNEVETHISGVHENFVNNRITMQHSASKGTVKHTSTNSIDNSASNSVPDLVSNSIESSNPLSKSNHIKNRIKNSRLQKLANEIIHHPDVKASFGGLPKASAAALVEELDEKQDTKPTHSTITNVLSGGTTAEVSSSVSQPSQGEAGPTKATVTNDVQKSSPPKVNSVINSGAEHAENTITNTVQGGKPGSIESSINGPNKKPDELHTNSHKIANSLSSTTVDSVSSSIKSKFPDAKTNTVTNSIANTQAGSVSTQIHGDGNSDQDSAAEDFLSAASPSHLSEGDEDALDGLDDDLESDMYDSQALLEVQDAHDMMVHADLTASLFFTPQSENRINSNMLKTSADHITNSIVPAFEGPNTSSDDKIVSRTHQSKVTGRKGIRNSITETSDADDKANENTIDSSVTHTKTPLIGNRITHASPQSNNHIKNQVDAGSPGLVTNSITAGEGP